MPFIPILMKILTALPWATIIKFAVGIFGKKDDPVSPGGGTSAKRPVTKITGRFNAWKARTWMFIANAQIGVKEIRGKNHNKQILKFHAATSLKASTDEVPWCASYTTWVLEKCGINSTRSARARSYEDWGIPVEKQYGAIVVLWRKSPTDGSGHVGFYIGEDKDKPGNIKILGGNQSNMVNISSYPEGRVLSYRWPIQE